MPTRRGQSSNHESVLASADRAAAAALRELPEALVLVFDEDMNFVLTAGNALGRAGSATCAPGTAISDAFPAELWHELEPLFRSAVEGETRSREIWTADERHCLMVDVGPLPQASEAEGEGAQGGVAVVLDITDRRRTDLISAPATANGFEEVFEQAPVGTGLLDMEGRWLLVNRALCEITGYTSEELIGKRFEGIMHPEEAVTDIDERRSLLAGRIPAFQMERRYFDAAGEAVTALVSMSLVRDRDGEPLHFIAQIQDVSERKDLEEHLRHLADHDQLTGLLNRRLFERDLRMQVARSRRYGEQAGLMVIDLDRFRAVNETYGQKIGDETLKVVARVLSRRLRETDVVARVAGGQFAVLLPHIDSEGLSVVAEGLSRVVPACSIDVGADVMHPTASIGFATIDEYTRSAEEVLAAAGVAVNEVKLAKAQNGL